MSWVRVHDGALSHPKIIGMVDTRRPFDLWVWGLSYAQLHLTDGLIPTDAVPRFSTKAVQELVRRGLWEAVPAGFSIHDHLQWNDSREVIHHERKLAKDRLMFMRNPELRKQLQARDGFFCRYCRRRVNWLDRKGSTGATYDHVDPKGDATLENLVVSCRGCNSRKKNRTPEQAGMILGPIPDLSRSDQETSDKNQTLIPLPLHINTEIKEEILADRSRGARLSGTTDPDVAARAGDFYREWEKLFEKYRFGATYFGNAQVDYGNCCRLVEKFSNARLADLAVVFLNSNEPFIESSTRSIPVFASRISWCDEQLRKAESNQRRSA